MVKRIDSDALGDVNLALGLSGAGSQLTELADGVVDQVLSVNELARRGRTQQSTQGLYYPTLRNVHSAADNESVTIDVYNVGATAQVEPYPSPMPKQFDVWLLGASLRLVSGGGSIGATLSLRVGTRAQGFGLVDDGTQVLVSQPIRLVFWNTLITVNSTTFAVQNDRKPHHTIGIRIPRIGSELIFASTSGAAATYDCQLIVGVFPAALGQDGVV